MIEVVVWSGELIGEYWWHPEQWKKSSKLTKEQVREVVSIPNTRSGERREVEDGFFDAGQLGYLRGGHLIAHQGSTYGSPKHFT